MLNTVALSCFLETFSSCVPLMLCDVTTACCGRSSDILCNSSSSCWCQRLHMHCATAPRLQLSIVWLVNIDAHPSVQALFLPWVSPRAEHVDVNHVLIKSFAPRWR